MRTLRLVALSDDGTRLVLAVDGPDQADTGERFEIAVDDRLRAAARGDAQRLGRIELDQGTTLTPRDIQSRIRAGETPEQVAEASGSRVERILRFAHPVLQERARVAEQARGARVRLTEGVTPVPLEVFMAERLRLLGADYDGVRWDAHRTDDGTWQVSAAWRGGHRSGIALWSYDIPARTVTPMDATTTDFAEGTRLVRVVPDVPAQPPGRPVAVVREAPAPAVAATEPQDDPDAHDTVVLGRLDELTETESGDPRASIPAWEDIVFGVRRRR